MRQPSVSPEPTEPTDPIILPIYVQRVPSDTTDSFLRVSFHNSFAFNSLAYVLPRLPWVPRVHGSKFFLTSSVNLCIIMTCQLHHLHQKFQVSSIGNTSIKPSTTSPRWTGAGVRTSPSEYRGACPNTSRKVLTRLSYSYCTSSITSQLWRPGRRLEPLWRLPI